MDSESSQRVDAPHLSGHGETNESKHGKTAILELLNFELLEVSRDERSEDTAGVADLVGRELV